MKIDLEVPEDRGVPQSSSGHHKARSMRAPAVAVLGSLLRLTFPEHASPNAFHIIVSKYVTVAYHMAIDSFQCVIQHGVHVIMGCIYRFLSF
jgi:hypothetical protein